MASRIEMAPVGPGNLGDLGVLFASERTTRHCWCMAFCTSSWRFAAGWYGGGNQRGFAAITHSSDIPMGVLASVDGQPAGWCSCGPRSRYTTALGGRSALLAESPRTEDDSVWLLACLFVGRPYRQDHLVRPLLRAAVDLAKDQGAAAVEVWPLAAGVRAPGNEHVGREEVFARLGFAIVRRATPDRVVMRLSWPS